MKTAASLLMIVGLVASAMLLGMYLNVDGHAVATMGKVVFAATMLVANAAGILFATR